MLFVFLAAAVLLGVLGGCAESGAVLEGPIEAAETGTTASEETAEERAHSRKIVLSSLQGRHGILSCRLLLHQFIKRDKTDQIILNVDALAALAAAFVRRTHIDRLDELMRRIGRQLLQSCVLLNPFNEKV